MKVNLEKYHWDGQRVCKKIGSGLLILGPVASVLDFEMIIWWDDYARPILYASDDPDFDKICIFESLIHLHNEEI
jgi:hypothetical protein